MGQNFVRIAPHLYKRQYQTSNGDWSTRFYCFFKDKLKGKRRAFPLGSDLKTAKEQLKVLEGDNVKEKDFDQEKEERENAKIQGMTLGVWLDRYLHLVKAKRSWDRDEQHCKHLTRLLGSLPLSLVNRPRIMEYKNQRLTEFIIRHKNPVEGKTVKISTINREIRCLLHALNLAVDEELIENTPRVRLDSENHLAHDRVLSEEEYRKLLEKSPTWLQRVFIVANDACLSRSDLLRLTWDCIVDGLIKVRGGRAKTGIKQRVGISPALRKVLTQSVVFSLRTVDQLPSTVCGRPLRRRGPMPRWRISHFMISDIARRQRGLLRVYLLTSRMWHLVTLYLGCGADTLISRTRTSGMPLKICTQGANMKTMVELKGS